MLSIFTFPKGRENKEGEGGGGGVNQETASFWKANQGTMINFPWAQEQ